MNEKDKRKITLNRFLLEKKAQFILFLVMAVIFVVAAPFKSYIMQWLIDSTDKTEALSYLALGIGLVLLSHISEYICRDTYMRMSTKCIQQVRNLLADTQSKKSISVLSEEKSGEVLSIFTNDLKMIHDEYYMGIFNMFVWGGMAIVALVMLISISPVLMVATVALCMLPLIVPKLMANGLSDARKEYSISIGRYTSKVGELLKGLQTLQTSGAMGYFVANQEKAAENNRNADVHLRKETNIAYILSSLAAWVPGIVVLFIGTFLVFSGKITIGYLVTANSLTNFVVAPIRQMSSAYVGLKSSRSLKQKIEAELNRKPEKSGTKEITDIQTVCFSDVSFTYPKGEKNALNDINLQLNKGQKIAIVGASGSGKSTLAKLLCRDYLGYDGKLAVNGVEMNEISGECYSQKISRIPQTPYIFSDTIKNNVGLFRACFDEQVTCALREAGLESFISEQSDGVNTVLSEGGQNLSGGQAQRICVARAFLQKSELIIADEATSSLDVMTTCDVMENLLRQNCTLVVITHDIYGDYMKKFDKIYYMENGRIAEQGNFMELLNMSGGFAGLYQNSVKESESC